MLARVPKSVLRPFSPVSSDISPSTVADSCRSAISDDGSGARSLPPKLKTTTSAMLHVTRVMNINKSCRPETALSDFSCEPLRCFLAGDNLLLFAFFRRTEGEYLFAKRTSPSLPGRNCSVRRDSLQS